MPEKGKQDIVCYADKYQKRIEEFVEDRLLPSSWHSSWDAMRNLKLKTFPSSNCTKNRSYSEGFS